MSSNLKVNNILPSTGDTVAVSGIASVTSSVSIASSCTATTFYGSGANLTGITSPAITSIDNDAVSRVLTTDGDGTATAHSEVKIETVSGNKRFSINRGTGSTEVPLLVRRTDASGIVAEFSNSGGYGVYIGQNGATGEGYIRTATGQPLVFTTNSGSGLANERLRITSDGTKEFKNHGGGTLKIGGSSAHTSKIVIADNGGTANGNCLVEGGDGTDFFTIQSNGNVQFPDGKGINFGASAGSNATSSILDDYEEGSWVPVIKGSSTAGTATYISRSARYVKIGRLVHVYSDVRWSAHDGAGGLEVHGLPYSQVGGYWGHFGINYNSGHSWTIDRQIYGWANIAGDFIRYWQTDSNGGSGNLPLDSVVGEIHFYGHYLTST